MTQDDMRKAEAALHAEERAITKKWCALKGHRWDLPAVSPFNHDILECEVICSRCNLHGKLVIVSEADSDPVSVPLGSASRRGTDSVHVDEPHGDTPSDT
jgi:hypothetical protein